MPNYVAAYTGIAGPELYRFQSPNDLRAGDEAIRHYVERYYVEDSFSRPIESRFFPAKHCLRKRIVGTFDDIFQEEQGKQKKICRSLFTVPKKEQEETATN